MEKHSAGDKARPVITIAILQSFTGRSFRKAGLPRSNNNVNNVHMSDDRRTNEYYGILGRVSFDLQRATLRFYPFALIKNDGRDPVLEVYVENPGFDFTAIKPFIDQEVEFSSASGCTQIVDVCAGETLIVSGSAISAKWRTYDIDDYRGATNRLKEREAKLSGDLTEAVRKINRISALATELLRRAEIKAAASSDLQRIQSPAIQILKRLLNELKS